MQKNKVGSLENFGINMGFLAIDIKTYPNSFKKFYNIFFCIYNPLSFTQFFFWSGVGEVEWGGGGGSGVGCSSFTLDTLHLMYMYRCFQNYATSYTYL